MRQGKSIIRSHFRFVPLKRHLLAGHDLASHWSGKTDGYAGCVAYCYLPLPTKAVEELDPNELEAQREEQRRSRAASGKAEQRVREVDLWPRKTLRLTKTFASRTGTNFLELPPSHGRRRRWRISLQWPRKAAWSWQLHAAHHALVVASELTLPAPFCLKTGKSPFPLLGLEKAAVVRR